jgi:hypothetical protein
MDLKCTSCKASLLKSYGNTIKLRSRSIRWEGEDTAVVQCNICRSFNDLPLELDISSEKPKIRLVAHIKKSVQKEKLIVTKDKKEKN